MEYVIVDYDPQKIIKAKEPYLAANKAFTYLSKKFNFIDNMNGQKYLKFSIKNKNTGRCYPMIGTRIKLAKPIYRKSRNGKEIRYQFDNIISRYTNDMNEVFEKHFYQ